MRTTQTFFVYSDGFMGCWVGSWFPRVFFKENLKMNSILRSNLMCELTTQFPFYFTKNSDQFRREETLRSPSKWITAKVLIFWSMSKRESLWQRNDVAILWFSWHRLLAHERVCWPKGKEDRNKSDRKSMFLFPSRRIHDVSRSGFNDWPFMSVHQWGESPQGVWELEIHNRGRYMGKLTFLSGHSSS